MFEAWVARPERKPGPVPPGDGLQDPDENEGSFAVNTRKMLLSSMVSFVIRETCR